jgi:dihydrolipoamide dehydrogenase
MMAQKEGSVRTLTGGIEFLFKKNKVVRLGGHATILGPNSVRVASDDGKGIFRCPK